MQQDNTAWAHKVHVSLQCFSKKVLQQLPKKHTTLENMQEKCSHRGWKQQICFTTRGKNTVEYNQATKEEMLAAGDVLPKGTQMSPPSAAGALAGLNLHDRNCKW